MGLGSGWVPFVIQTQQLLCNITGQFIHYERAGDTSEVTKSQGQFLLQLPEELPV